MLFETIKGFHEQSTQNSSSLETVKQFSYTTMQKGALSSICMNIFITVVVVFFMGVVLNRPSYSSDLSFCDYFQLEMHLKRIRNNSIPDI